MRPEAEGDVFVRLAIDVEPERIVEHRLVAVGRRIAEKELVALRPAAAFRVAVSTTTWRAMFLIGDTHRSISSTVPSMWALGSAARRAR